MSDDFLTSPTLLKKSSTLGSVRSLTRLSKLVSTRTIEPSGSWYRRWWFFTTVCALATAFFTPWEVAFTREPGLSPYTDAPAVIEYLLTSVFVMDIFVQLNVAFINAEGRIEIGRRAITTHYLKLKFWIDLIGVIPFNTILDIFVDTNANQRTLALLRVFRLVRAHRLWALFRDFEMNIRLHLLTITLIRNFTIVIVANHWAACIFYYISRQYDFDEDTWIGANLPDIANADNLEDINFREWHKYVYSLYWSITTMTTVGYGDFSPKNITEVIFASACMLFNIALNAYILGAITIALWHRRNVCAVCLQRRGHEKLARFAHKHRLSQEMQKNLNNHLKYNYLHPEIQDSELMVHLPSNLRRKVMYELYGDRLAQSPVFKACSRSFIASLLEPHEDSGRQNMCVEIYLTEDEIITEDEYVSCLYVILSGSAILQKSELGVLDAFPVELFLDVPDNSNSSLDFQFSPYTVRANSTCRVLCIPRKTLLRSFRSFPTDRDRFQQEAQNYVQKRYSPASSIACISNPTSARATPPLRKSSTVRFSEEIYHGWPEMDASTEAFFVEIKADSGDDVVAQDSVSGMESPVHATDEAKENLQHDTGGGGIR